MMTTLPMGNLGSRVSNSSGTNLAPNGPSELPQAPGFPWQRLGLLIGE